MSITSITASQRLDSRGKPTVNVSLATFHGTFHSIVPSGASKGDYEAVELRDGDESKFQGNGVLKAIHNVEKVLGPALKDSKLEPGKDLRKIDELMIKLDGTDDKSKLGANAVLAISMAAARAGAASQGVPLYEFLAMESGHPAEYIMPVPFFNVLNGGDHSGNAMAFQEFMIAPVGASSINEAVQFAAETYAELKQVISKKYGKSAIGIGDEGGFAPPYIAHPHEALDLLMTAISQAGHNGKIKIGIDPASQSFFKDGKYDMGFKTDKPDALSAQELAELYNTLLEKYPVILLEDPFGQDDWDAWVAFKRTCKVELVGDDLLATNIHRIKIAAEKDACNSLLLKINQIGTITESIDAAKKAYSLNWAVFVSHRSGETTDDFIADLVVGLKTGHLKSGAPCRGERVAKYNRLMDIEDEIKGKGLPCGYAGPEPRYTHKKGAGMDTPQANYGKSGV